jgi:hypothetical protein
MFRLGMRVQRSLIFPLLENMETVRVLYINKKIATDAPIFLPACVRHCHCVKNRYSALL